MVTRVPLALLRLCSARPPPQPSVTTLSWILQLVTVSVPAPAFEVLLPSHSMPPPDPSAAKLSRFRPNRISRLVRCVSKALSRFGLMEKILSAIPLASGHAVAVADGVASHD